MSTFTEQYACDWCAHREATMIGTAFGQQPDAKCKHPELAEIKGVRGIKLCRAQTCKKFEPHKDEMSKPAASYTSWDRGTEVGWQEDEISQALRALFDQVVAERNKSADALREATPKGGRGWYEGLGKLYEERWAELRADERGLKAAEPAVIEFCKQVASLLGSVSESAIVNELHGMKESEIVSAWGEFNFGRMGIGTLWTHQTFWSDLLMRTELRAFVDSLITREREKRGAVPKPEKSDVDWRVRAFCGQVAPFMDGNAGSLMDDLHGLTYADLMRAWDRSDLCRYPINDLPNSWHDILLRREVQSFVYSLIYEQRKLPEYQPPAQAAEVNTQFIGVGGVAMLLAAQKKHDQRVADEVGVTLVEAMKQANAVSSEIERATTDWISQYLSPDWIAEHKRTGRVCVYSGERPDKA